MKRKLTLALLTVVMSLGFALSVSAAPDIPGMPNYDLEPVNNDWRTAPLMQLDNLAEGTQSYKGFFQGTTDGDYYRFKTEGDLMVQITFWPPDTQQYYVAISEITPNGLKGVKGQFYASGVPEPTEFRPKAKTEYAVMVMPWNIVSTPTAPYIISFGQFQ